MDCKLKSEDFREYIIRRNISYSDICELLGISKQHLSAIIHGRSGVKAEYRKMLLDNFSELSFDDLFEILKEGDDE